MPATATTLKKRFTLVCRVLPVSEALIMSRARSGAIPAWAIATAIAVIFFGLYGFAPAAGIPICPIACTWNWYRARRNSSTHKFPARKLSPSLKSGHLLAWVRLPARS
jgi:hypothetical protein